MLLRSKEENDGGRWSFYVKILLRLRPGPLSLLASGVHSRDTLVRRRGERDEEQLIPHEGGCGNGWGRRRGRG